MEKWEMIDPYYGAHIRVFVNNTFYHHGIYVGDDKVIQFGKPIVTPNYSDIKVEEVTINEFLNGGFLEVKIFNRKEKKLKRKDEEIVAFAYSMIGTDGYDLLKNNCEHFANLCVFGQKTSAQVDDFRKEIRAKLNLK